MWEMGCLILNPGDLIHCIAWCLGMLPPRKVRSNVCLYEYYIYPSFSSYTTCLPSILSFSLNLGKILSPSPISAFASHLSRTNIYWITQEYNARGHYETLTSS